VHQGDTNTGETETLGRNPAIVSPGTPIWPSPIWPSCLLALLSGHLVLDKIGGPYLSASVSICQHSYWFKLREISEVRVARPCGVRRLPPLSRALSHSLSRSLTLSTRQRAPLGAHATAAGGARAGREVHMCVVRGGRCTRRHH
jgi:hypothetical protein